MWRDGQLAIALNNRDSLICRYYGGEFYTFGNQWLSPRDWNFVDIWDYLRPSDYFEPAPTGSEWAFW